jgi:hypothetical protein
MQEVFIPVDSAESAARVMALNDAAAAAEQKERFATLRKKQVVHEHEFSDVRRAAVMAAAKAR